MEWKRLQLPATTLGLLGAPRCVCMARATMLTELDQFCVSTSIFCGPSRWAVIREAFQDALLPITTIIALSLTHMIGGSVVIKTIFNWPGVESYTINSILVHGYPVVQGYTTPTVTTVIVVNLLVETTYLLAGPTVRRDGDASVVPN